MITTMKEIAGGVSQVTTVIKAGILTIARDVVLMAMAEVVRVRAISTTRIKGQVVRAIAIEAVPIMIIKIQIVHQTVSVVETAIAEIQARVRQEIQIVVLHEIRAEALTEIRAGVLPEIRTGVLPEIQTEVLQETVGRKVAHAPIHQTEEDRILPAPVAHAASNQVVVGKVREDVKKALRKVHRAKNNDRNQAKNRA
jgi:hypothetical protein